MYMIYIISIYFRLKLKYSNHFLETATVFIKYYIYIYVFMFIYSCLPLLLLEPYLKNIISIIKQLKLFAFNLKSTSYFMADKR